jgi:hypothetical protein
MQSKHADFLKPTIDMEGVAIWTKTMVGHDENRRKIEFHLVQ